MGANDPGKEPYTAELIQLYQHDGYSHIAREWNLVRGQAVKIAVEDMLYPTFAKELRAKLVQEARDHVLKECTAKLANWLKVGPYQVDTANRDEEDSDPGVRVLGISYSTEPDQVGI